MTRYNITRCGETVHAWDLLQMDERLVENTQFTIESNRRKNEF